MIMVCTIIKRWKTYQKKDFGNVEFDMYVVWLMRIIGLLIYYVGFDVEFPSYNINDKRSTEYHFIVMYLIRKNRGQTTQTCVEIA